MENVFDLVQAYREEMHSETRTELAGKIAEILVRELRVFVIGRIHPSLVDDVVQDTVIDVISTLFRFKGKTEAEFWGWCRTIARNNAVDRFRRESADRMSYFPSVEIWQLLDATEANLSPLSPEDRMDFKYVMDLLAKSEPGCREFLWSHYMDDLNYSEISDMLRATNDWDLNYDAVRMRINRCLETARKLLN